MSFSRTKKAASSKSVVADKASAMASPQGSQSVQNLKDLSVESPKSVIAAPAADPAESSAAAQHVDISDASFAAAKSAGVRAWAATQVQAAARGHSQRKVTAQPTMAGGLATVVHPDALSSVDLLPGAFSARHGGHIGGVVDLHLDDARPAQPTGSVSIDLLQSAAQVEAPFGEAGLSFDLAARRSYADVVLSQVTLSPEEGGLLRQLPVYGDAMARLRLDGEGGHRFRG
jgi:outer membrane receptor protein involved in Fe transport